MEDRKDYGWERESRSRVIRRGLGQKNRCSTEEHREASTNRKKGQKKKTQEAERQGCGKKLETNEHRLQWLPVMLQQLIIPIRHAAATWAVDKTPRLPFVFGAIFDILCTLCRNSTMQTHVLVHSWLHLEHISYLRTFLFIENIQ